MLCSESKAQTKINKTFSQEKPALLMVSTHGQRECIVDKTAVNFPTNFRKPFIQTSEGYLKSLFPIHSQNIPMNSWNANFIAVPELVFPKIQQNFTQIDEMIEYRRNFLRKRYFLRRFFWTSGWQFWQSFWKNMAYKPKCFLSKSENNTSKFHLVSKWSSRQGEGRFFFNSAENCS